MILNEKGKQAEKFANFLGGKSGFLKVVIAMTSSMLLAIY